MGTEAVAGSPRGLGSVPSAKGWWDGAPLLRTPVALVTVVSRCD